MFKFIFAKKKRFNPAQVVLTKMLRNKAKIYQETDFLSTEGHYFINFIWLLPDFNFLIGRCTG